MKTRPHLLLLIYLIVLITYSKSYATHGMGMDLTYQCLGNNSYTFQLAFYRDCGGATAPGSAVIRLRSASCSRNFTRTLNFVSSNETTPVCASLQTECTGGAFPGAEEYIYRGTFTLPAQCPDWVISYTLCCRNNDINTINAPGAANIYTETTLNNTLSACNSSPSFSNDPVPFVCSNQPYCFNNGAIDSDGDSLVYSLVTPKTGPNLQDTVVFLTPFTAVNPITSTPMLTLNPLTGDLCMTPTDSNQIGVLAVLVEEYRNGILIGSIRRDIQLRILGCPNGNSPPTVSGIDSSTVYTTKVCAGDTLNFSVFSNDNDSGQTLTMSWNNGIPTANFNISAGPRPVGSFNWIPANNEIRRNPYCFTVTISDDNCPFEASQVFSYCIFVSGITSVIDSIEPPSCNSFCDGIGVVEIVNGTPPYTYSWNDPLNQTTAVATGLCDGIYTITGTDSVGCVTATNVAITQPDTLRGIGTVTSNYKGADISCFGFNDGAASALITGGTPPYSLTWDANTGNQTSDTAIGLSSGTYSFQVIDSKGCDTTGTVILNDPVPLTGQTQIASDYNGRMISCPGASDGALFAIASGGTGNKYFSWDGNAFNQTTDTAFGLNQGSYSVTITDDNGCDTTLTDSLKDPPLIVPDVSVISNYNGAEISCNGLSDGIAFVKAIGGTPSYTYQWGLSAGSSMNDTVFGLAAGTYLVTVKDTNGCSVLDSVSVLEPDSVKIYLLSQINVFCNGQSTGQVAVTGIGGTAPYSYSWNTSPVVNDSLISGLAVGTYIVTATDTNGCQGDSAITITQSAAISANITPINLKCNSINNGQAYASPTGGNPPFTYRWNTNLGIQGSDTARNLSATKHYLTVTDAFNCTALDSVTLTQPDPILVAVSANDTICENAQSVISANASGGVGSTYTYNWNNALPALASHLVSPNATTLYIVSATDSIGCTSDPEVITVYIRDFSEDSLEVISAGDICRGDSTAVEAIHIARFNSYSYVWNPFVGSDVGPIVVSPDSSKYYRITVSDICGNSISDSVFVNVLPLPEISLPDTIASGCAPLEVNFVDSLNRGKNYRYQWSFGLGRTSIDPSPIFVYQSSGNYIIGLELTDENGCTAVGEAVSIVEVFDTPVIDFTANPISTTTQNPTINFTNGSTLADQFFWRFGDDSTSSLFSPTHIYADSGIYEVWLIGTNGKGCIDSSRLIVEINPYFEIEIPNAFTPNPDFSSGGKYNPEALNNDVFFPHTTGVAEYELLIYNRWGELIFQSDRHEIGWDGYYKGVIAQQEVYIYKLRIKWINGQQFRKVGDLTLFR